MEELDIYTHQDICRNCGHLNIVDIPKGRTITEYLRSIRCSNCGVSLRSSPQDSLDRISMRVQS